MKHIDLNCDLGESFGAYTIGNDERVIPLISSANVACGFHAADPVVMDRTVRMAKEAGCKVGAHIGFPDLMGFGRRNMVISAEEAKTYTIYQLGALKGFLDAYGLKMQHVKPHGALYNMAAKDHALSLAICEGIKAVDPQLILMGLAGSEMLKAAEELGLPTASEVFADRAYMPDGSLVPRSREGAVIHDEDEACRRVLRMVTEGTVEAINGTVIPLKADTVCVHGDNDKALLFVQKIRAMLKENGCEIRSLCAGRSADAAENLCIEKSAEAAESGAKRS